MIKLCCVAFASRSQPRRYVQVLSLILAVAGIIILVHWIWVITNSWVCLELRFISIKIPRNKTWFDNEHKFDYNEWIISLFLKVSLSMIVPHSIVYGSAPNVVHVTQVINSLELTVQLMMMMQSEIKLIPMMSYQTVYSTRLMAELWI